MVEVFDDCYAGVDKGYGGSCGGIIKWSRGMKIRDKIYYLRLYNKKHVKSHESIVWAGDLDDAEKLYNEVKTTLPKHVYHEFSEYALENRPIEIGVA